MAYEFFFDGCCEPTNPNGHMGLGVVINDHLGNLVHEISYGCIVGENWHDPTSNNVAEYLALLSAMKWIKNQPELYNMANFFGDSKLVIGQMNGEWHIGSGLYIEYAHKAKKRMRELFKENGVDCCFFWIPREKNEHADRLSKKALTDKGIKITDRSKFKK